MKIRQLKGLMFLLPSFAGVCVFWVIPYIDVIRRSFFSAVTEEFTGIENYKVIFTNQAFRLACKNTLRFFGICIPILVVLSLVIAVIITKQKKWVQLTKSMFLLPMAIPVASVVLLWRIMFHSHGILSGWVEWFGHAVWLLHCTRVLSNTPDNKPQAGRPTPFPGDMPDPA